jgi:hypothetical protein
LACRNCDKDVLQVAEGDVAENQEDSEETSLVHLQVHHQ